MGNSASLLIESFTPTQHIVQVIDPQRAGYDGYSVYDQDKVTLSYAAPFNRKPRARFVRMKRVDNLDLAISIASIEVFDYTGMVLQPVSVSTFPPGPTLQTFATRAAFILVDFGIEREIAGVRVTNVAGSPGATNIGCSIQVLTNGSVAVFGVKIGDNRLVYNIRTCPPSPEAKYTQFLRNQDTIPFKEHCCHDCCSCFECFNCGCCYCTQNYTRATAMRRLDERAVNAARRNPNRQNTMRPNVNFGAALIGSSILISYTAVAWLILAVVVGGLVGAGAGAAYNDPPSHGGYDPQDPLEEPRGTRMHSG